MRGSHGERGSDRERRQFVVPLIPTFIVAYMHLDPGIEPVRFAG